MGVDHVKVQRVRNSLLCCPLSPRAKQMLEQIAERSLPPILLRGPWPRDMPWFGEDMQAAEEFHGPYQELDDRGLVTVDSVVEEGKTEENGDKVMFYFWVTLRFARDLPERGEGLLA